MLFYDFSRILPNDEDQKYVAELLGIEFDFKLNISRQLRTRHIKEILELTQWEKHMPSKHRDILLDQANTLASIHPKPIFIFTEIIRKLIDNKISMPAYTELQLIVSKAITNYEKSIVKQILRIPKHQLYV